MNKEKRARNIPVQSWLNQEENDRLLELSARSGLKKTVVIRRLIMGVEIRELPPLEATAILIELKRIGNNINQIAAMMNAGLGLNKSEYQSQYQRLMSILEQMQKAIYGG